MDDDFSWGLLLSIISLINTVLITLIGWHVSHKQNLERDELNNTMTLLRDESNNTMALLRDESKSRRELKWQHMNKAFEVLTDNFYRVEVSYREVERALTSIQLWGSRRQVVLANQLQDAMQTRNADFPFLDKVSDLRDSLREELKLDKLDEGGVQMTMSLLRLKDKEFDLEVGRGVPIQQIAAAAPAAASPTVEVFTGAMLDSTAFIRQRASQIVGPPAAPETEASGYAFASAAGTASAMSVAIQGSIPASAPAGGGVDQNGRAPVPFLSATNVDEVRGLPNTPWFG